MPINSFDKEVPIIGAKPQMRVYDRRIENLQLNDEQGSAELKPTDDLTISECYKLNLMLAWILMQPTGPIPDPQTNGRTGLLVRTAWRDFIIAEKLERHFLWRKERLDLPPAQGTV